jgi:hypothetical protein
LIERDGNLPDFEVLLAERKMANTELARTLLAPLAQETTA